MGFYGSIYYQITNAFAKILITNKGKSDSGFADQNNILKDEIAVYADGRNGSFYLDAGNKWIQLEGNENTNFCTIWHGPPDADGAKGFVIPLEKVNEPTQEMLAESIPLEGGTCFSTPVIYYDNAGHVVPSGYVKYFTIPKTDYETDLETMKDDIESLYEENNQQGSNIAKLQGKVENINAYIDHFTEAMSSVQSNIGDMEKYTEDTKYTDLASGIQDLKTDTETNTKSVEALWLEITEIKKRLAALEG